MDVGSPTRMERGRRRRGRRPPGRAAPGHRARRRHARHEQRHATPRRACSSSRASAGRRSWRSALDSYVTRPHDHAGRALPRADGREPLTVRRDDLIGDIAEEVKDIHYRAAVAVDSSGRPVGLVTRSDLVNPEPRRVLLVDHAEAAQSVPGIDEAEIVEILDHHHIGSIETRVPVARHLRPGRLDGDARGRALPSGGPRAAAPDGADAARSRSLRHGDPQLADDDPARPRDHRVPRAHPLARRPGVRARDVRGHVRRLACAGRGDRRARRQGLRGRRRPDDLDRAARDRRRLGARPPRRAARGAGRASASARATRSPR